MRNHCAILGLCGILALTACDGGGVLEGDDVPSPGGALFLRYVSLGNSITAGFQSGGLNDSIQQEAYPVLLAAAAGASFRAPSMRMPGCPPPLLDPHSGARVGGAGASCSGRIDFRTGTDNLAVPGAALIDLLSNEAPASSPNPLTGFILGGETQLEALVAAEPTLVSVWIGNNDALAAALTGDTTLLTPADSFGARLEAVVEVLNASTAEDVILIGVVDPLLAPVLQPGAWYHVLATTGGAPAVFETAPSCAPGAPTSANLVSLLIASPPVAADDTIPIDCADDAAWVVTAAEGALISERVAGYNAAIEAAAAARGWIYVDPSAVLAPYVDDPDRIRKCQTLAAAVTPEARAAAATATCPGPTAPNWFGSLLSHDGIHPSSEAHRIIAAALALRLNQKHGLALPVP